MNAAQFDLYWTTTYPDAIPLGYRFRHLYTDRWFRIHSLPESKRYPDNEQEWDILLERQNILMTDLLGNDEPILLMAGDHGEEGYTELHPLATVTSIAAISFVKLEPMNLHKLNPEEFEPNHTYTPVFSEQTWQYGKFDPILRDIAQDELRCLFVSIPNQCIVAPYDGGVDVVLKDPETMHQYKQKYAAWLSAHPSGW